MIKKKKSGKLKIGALSILMFLVIYDFQILPQFPSFTTIRLSAIIILLWGMIRQGKGLKITLGRSESELSFRRYLTINVVLLLYTTLLLIIWGEGTGYTVTNIYLNILIFSAPIYYGCKYIFDDIDEFMHVIIIVSLVQCVFIFAGLVSPAVRSWLRRSFYYNSSFELSGHLSNMRGYAYGISCITSKGSQKLSLGLIATTYCMLKKNKVLKYSIAFLIISAAATTVARTGFLYAVIAIIIILCNQFRVNRNQFAKILTTFLGMILLLVIVSFTLGDVDQIKEMFWRLLVLFEQGPGHFFALYFKGETTAIPKISIETIIGTGIWSGMSGSGIVINADGGYFRTYFALGLVMAIFYYWFFFSNIRRGIRQFRGVERTICNLFIILIILGEFKEPLLFDWYYQTVLFVFIYLCENRGSETNYYYMN